MFESQPVVGCLEGLNIAKAHLPGHGIFPAFCSGCNGGKIYRRRGISDGFGTGPGILDALAIYIVQISSRGIHLIGIVPQRFTGGTGSKADTIPVTRTVIKVGIVPC